MQNRLFLMLLFPLSLFFSEKITGQNASINKGIGAVAEIIVPDQTDMISNFTLMYEVKFIRKEIPAPSFWYKIVFGDTCSFKFTMFPLSETDRYDFYLYKIFDNYNFCAALGENKIISCDSNKYKAGSQETGIKAGLVGAHPVKVKGGDAIYIEVFSTKGWDGGHVLDFRLSDSAAFVVKVQNDYVDTTRSVAKGDTNDYSFKNISTKEMQDLFCKTLSDEATVPHHLLYTKEQATKDSIAISKSQKNKVGAIANGGNSQTSMDEITKTNMKLRSAIAIFNAIKDKPLSKAKNPVFIENYIPEKGVLYKVQVGFFMSDSPGISVFKGLSPVFQEKTPIGMKYSVGSFSNYELASIGKTFVRSLGLGDAFIVAYYNGKRVPIIEAQSHEKE